MDELTGVHGFSVQQLVELRRADALAVSPCGTWAAVAVARLDAERASYVPDLWRVSLGAPASPAVQPPRGASGDRRPGLRRAQVRCPARFRHSVRREPWVPRLGPSAWRVRKRFRRRQRRPRPLTSRPRPRAHA